MKLHELQAVAKRLNDFDFISRVRRVENNTIEITFTKQHSYFFNMTRGHSHIYKADPQRLMQSYNAPFDTLLHSLLSRSKLQRVDILDNDRILQFDIAARSSYKDKTIRLQLEFTGKNTNAILLDENGIIIEALRHIDADSSFRVVRPGVELLSLPLRPKKENIDRVDTGSALSLEDIDMYLETLYLKTQEQKIEQAKKVKSASITKKIKKISQTTTKLPDQKKLAQEASTYQEYGNIILANIYHIKPFDKYLKTDDFLGNPVEIPLPEDIKPTRMSDYYFSLSKKAKNRAKNIHIEVENLSSKKLFYENILHAIENAKTFYELELLVPKKAKQQRKKEKLRFGELFWIEDYKVMVGRNSNENQKLLQAAKGNDIWMHTREIPGSHVIIRTDKQNLPDSVLQAAAKLCVDFSAKASGDYLVDYTKRKFVKIQEGSSVEYDKYQTIAVRKDGVEIRE